MDSPLTQYRQMETLGKSQVELIIQVYDGALVSFATAREAVDRQDYARLFEAMEQAKKLMVHLYMTLDFDKGRDIAGHLGKLYAYLINQIDFIQATKDAKKIDSCMSVLQNLRSGWIDLGKQIATLNAPAAAAQTVAEPALNMSV